MNLEPDFSDFIEALKQNNVEFVIVGAFALGHHGAPRATGDFDVWVRPRKPNAAATIKALADFGFPTIAVKPEDILSGKVIQLGVAPVRIDILSDLSGVTADEIWNLKVSGRLGPHTVYFIGRETFVKNKRAAGRDKDRADLTALGEGPSGAGKHD